MERKRQKTHAIPEATTETSLSARVILFNDDLHTFHEVTAQLTRAIGCPSDEAFQFAYLVHTNGSAPVFAGPFEQCLGVSWILEEIRLLTRVECAETSE
jgi:ATP-dependent Clp protease adaptor protein ClpS